jgi:hypothetical protein
MDLASAIFCFFELQLRGLRNTFPGSWDYLDRLGAVVP